LIRAGRGASIENGSGRSLKTEDARDMAGGLNPYSSEAITIVGPYEVAPKINEVMLKIHIN